MALLLFIIALCVFAAIFLMAITWIMEKEYKSEEKDDENTR